MHVFANQDICHNFDVSYEFALEAVQLSEVDFFEFYLSFQPTSRDFSYQQALFRFAFLMNCFKIDLDQLFEDLFLQFYDTKNFVKKLHFF